MSDSLNDTIYACSVHTEALTRKQSEHNPKGCKNRRKVNGRRTARMSGQISGKEGLISGTDSDQKEDALPQYEPESECGRKKNDALGLTECKGGLTSIEHPHWNEVQNVEEGASPRKPGPKRVSISANCPTAAPKLIF